VAEGEIDPNTPCLAAWVDEGGDEQPKRHHLPYEMITGEPHLGYITVGGRAFVRAVGDALVAADRIVRIEHFPLPPWGATPKGE
jgi:hypothetical protein